MKTADPDNVSKQMEKLFDVKHNEILRVSYSSILKYSSHLVCVIISNLEQPLKRWSYLLIIINGHKVDVYIIACSVLYLDTCNNCCFQSATGYIPMI